MHLERELKRFRLANQDWTTLALKFPVRSGQKVIHLIGVHHKSRASVERINELFPLINPELVCLEIVPRKELPKQYRIMGKSTETNTKLSDEMEVAMTKARNIGAKIELIDEPLRNCVNSSGLVSEAIDRFSLKRRPRMPLVFEMLKFVSFKNSIENDLVKDLTSIGDMNTYCRLLRLKDDNLEKRDACMALRIHDLMGNHNVGVAVVGKSHVFGIRQFLDRLYGNQPSANI